MDERAQARRTMLLPIGATVRARNGTAGRLKYVVVDPEDAEVTHLIVERGMLLRRDVVVPATWVMHSTEDEIEVNATVEELNSLPQYREIDYMAPDPSYHPPDGRGAEEVRFWVGAYTEIRGGKPRIEHHVRLGVDDKDVILRRGQSVEDKDGQIIGVLDHLVVQPPEEHVTHLVVRRGWLWNKEARIVPFERVSSVTDYAVRLNMSVEEIDQLPLYYPPASDVEIAASVQRAIDTDPRTAAAGVRVEVRDGVVHFIGKMSDQVRHAAESIARRIHGVIGFSYEDVGLAAPPLEIGAPVYARDGRYGTLDKVVVDPRSRRVTHVVIRKGWLLGEDRVIPVDRIERAEPDGVYLSATAAELNRYPRYEEHVFVEPFQGWEPLSTYSAASTLWFVGIYTGVPPPVMPEVERVQATGVPEGEVVLNKGADVVYNGDVVAILEETVVDPKTKGITNLVVKDMATGYRYIVPAEWIHELATDLISLKKWDPGQAVSPRGRLLNEEASSAPGRTGNGPRAGRSKEGEGEKPLSTDTQLVAKVVAGLAADRRTVTVPIEVVADRGTITLEGAVPSLEVKNAAEAITRRVPGVVAVTNELEVKPKDTFPETAVVPPHLQGT